MGSLVWQTITTDLDQRDFRAECRVSRAVWSAPLVLCKTSSNSSSARAARIWMVRQLAWGVSAANQRLQIH